LDKKTIAFDLETIADRTVIPFLPEVEPDSRLKDPIKIAANVADKKEKQVAELGLNPATAAICCFGFFTENGASHIPNNGSETQLIRDAWGVLSGYNHFVTFNGSSFDIPILLMRSLKHRIRPAVKIDNRKYQVTNHTDVRMILTNWNQMAKGKLPFFYQILTGQDPGEEIEGSDVQGYWDAGMKDDIFRHCEQDCKMTWELYRLIKSYYII